MKLSRKLIATIASIVSLTAISYAESSEDYHPEVIDRLEYEAQEKVMPVIQYVKYTNHSATGNYLNHPGAMSVNDCLWKCSQLPECKIAIYHREHRGCYLNGYGAALAPYQGIDAYVKTYQ